MIFKYEYANETERTNILQAHLGKRLVEEQNIAEGNFLIFTDEEPIEMQITELKTENTLLKAKSQANSDRADFHEEVLTEIIMTIHS